jgi:hypothetical protein
MRMVHHRQRLPFRFKPRDHGSCIHAGLNDLESHLTAHRFELLSEVNDAESTFADSLQQLVVADPFAVTFSERLGESGIHVLWLKVTVGIVMSLEKSDDPPP